LLQYPRTCWVICLELHAPQNPKGKATRKAFCGKTEFRAKSSAFLPNSQSANAASANIENCTGSVSNEHPKNSLKRQVTYCNLSAGGELLLLDSTTSTGKKI